MRTFIHCGSAVYDPQMVEKQHYAIPIKPNVGLWASPTDAEYPWAEWCKDNGFEVSRLNKHFEFALSDDANILRVKCYKDIEPYLGNNDTWQYGLLTEALREKFDGLEVLFSELDARGRSVLSTYDCDSICIWNPDVIVPANN